MKAKDDLVEKGILRVALGEIQSLEATKGEDLDDEQIVAILRKLAKSATESLELAPQADQREKLRMELEVLGSLLPKTLSEGEILAALEPVRETLLGARNDGQATGIAMKHLKAAGASVTGQAVSQAVRALRS